MKPSDRLGDSTDSDAAREHGYRHAASWARQIDPVIVVRLRRRRRQRDRRLVLIGLGFTLAALVVTYVWLGPVL